MDLFFCIVQYYYAGQSPQNHIYLEMDKNLPVLIINNWAEVTEKFLCNREHEIKQQTFNLEKAFMPYGKKTLDCLKQYKAKKKRKGYLLNRLFTTTLACQLINR